MSEASKNAKRQQQQQQRRRPGTNYEEKDAARNRLRKSSSASQLENLIRNRDDVLESNQVPVKQASSTTPTAPAPASAPVSLSGIPAPGSAWATAAPPVSFTDDHDTAPRGRSRLHRVSTEQFDNRTSQRQHQQQQQQQDSHPTSDSQQEQQQQQHPSLSDRIASSALQGTLEFLKVAGGVTLSTTGKLAGPPLHVTRTVLLPALWHASWDLLSSHTPDRVKDWLRIVRASLHHFVSVLTNTARGQVFRARLVIVLTDLRTLLTSATTRQVLVDGTACFVKLAEWLDTAEYHAFLQQASIWSCRLLQAVSSGQTQQLSHNVAAACQSAAQLLADPHTTVALAEVTAYLCHALEMQQQQDWSSSDGVDNDNVSAADAGDEDAPAAKKSTASPHKQKRQRAAASRKERNRYNHQTNLDRKTVQDPTATVEQIILSSLGRAVGGDEDAASDHSDNRDDAASVPSQIDCSESDNDNDGRESRGGGGIDWDSSSSIRRHVDAGPAEENEENDFVIKTRTGVNVPYLRQEIYARAFDMQHAKQQEQKDMNFGIQQAQATTRDDDDDVDDVENLRIAAAEAPLGRRAKSAVPIHLEEPVHSAEHDKKQRSVRTPEEGNMLGPTDGSRREGETPVQHFYRMLNEILETRQNEAFKDMVTLSHQSTHSWGRVTLRGGRPSRLSDLVRKRLAAVGEGVEQKQEIRNKRLVLLALFILAGLAVTWFGLGCYGLYAMLSPRGNLAIGRSPGSVATTRGPNAVASNEIVIRVVREVVRVDADGNYVSQKSIDESPISDGELEDIAQCVAKHVK